VNEMISSTPEEKKRSSETALINEAKTEKPDE
jgi:hypothetical protein